jgi:hypothetical protein
MNFEARLAALERLAESGTAAAQRALEREFNAAQSNLDSRTEYDLLEQSLSILNAIGFRFSSVATESLIGFIYNIDTRVLTYSEQDLAFSGFLSGYRDATALIVKAMDALIRLRYLETVSILRALIRLSSHPTEAVERKAIDGLKRLSQYDMSVFYGRDGRGGIGAAPQMAIVEELERSADLGVDVHFTAIVEVLDGVLSPTIEGATWSSSAVTLSFGAVPVSGSVSEVRSRAIQLLIWLYSLSDDVRRRLAIITSLTGASRTENRGSQNEGALVAHAENARIVLEFFVLVVDSGDLQVIQKIEHDAYWMFVRSSSEEVKVAALAVQQKISRCREYQIYRVLVGFQGIFGDWQQLRAGDRQWDGVDALRRDAAKEYAESVDADNYNEWRERIISYGKTSSQDMAMFSTLYYFLECFALASPVLAFKLLSENLQQVQLFQIPLLRGLWSGPQNGSLRKLLNSWIESGTNLYPAMKLFSANGDRDLELVKAILNRAGEVDDVATIREAVSVAVSNYAAGDNEIVDKVFLPAVSGLTQRGSAGWIYDNWFRREIKALLDALDDSALKAILQNLRLLNKIDYHAEEILSVIAERNGGIVLEFLCERLDNGRKVSSNAQERYEPAPYELHKLNKPWAKLPEVAVSLLRSDFQGSFSSFIHGGAALLSNIFEDVSGQFEVELLKLVERGEERDYLFVLAVIRNYDGDLSIHNVCKRIVSSVPAGSEFLGEVAIALESTGVVSGEFGIAEAYERKIQEIRYWLDDPNPRVVEFAKWYVQGLERMRESELARAKEGIDLRKFRYGED